MKTYEKQIHEFGKEIADEILRKEDDYSYQASLDKTTIARSISNIYNQQLEKTMDDLEKSISVELRKRRLY